MGTPRAISGVTLRLAICAFGGVSSMRITLIIWIRPGGSSMRGGVMRRCTVLRWGCLRIRIRSIGMFLFVSFSLAYGSRGRGGRSGEWLGSWV